MLRATLQRSIKKFVTLDISVNTWLRRLPSVDEARPSCCPQCGQASRPTGGVLKLHGHGLRERQLRGPLAPGGPAKLVLLMLRRYRCRGCRALITVAPCSVTRGRLFSAAAIGLALALWASGTGETAAEVRRQVSPDAVLGDTAAAGWAALRRWVQAIRTKKLFTRVRACPAGLGAREVAAHAAAALASMGPLSASGESLLTRAFAGAAHAG